ncbi:MAG: GGDEF domain-containing protein [Arcobacter sp.]|nr:MAG: GGDEF domain-containing protein [Arcobacter sp.]
MYNSPKNKPAKTALKMSLGFKQLEGADFVEKNEAKEIITSAYHSIIKQLQSQKVYDSKVLIDQLHTLAKALQENTSQPLSMHSTNFDLESDYKSIAKESLESYAQTKESVERINKKQEEVLQENTRKNDFKVNDLMQSFNKIHDEISFHMNEAHETIEDLNKQILQLERKSNLDPLTKTFNRRSLDKYLGALCQMKGKTPQSNILLIDIDDFKKTNDTYGHIAGDRVLIFLAKLINSILREGDKVFRFGGEEFLVLLNRCGENAAHNIASRILEGVRKSSLLYKNDQIKITLSIGSAELQKDDDFDAFVDRADKALYKAKDNGKDQFVAG